MANATAGDMMKTDRMEPAAAPDTGCGGRRHLSESTRTVPGVARSLLKRTVEPARSAIATLGPLAAALWALYPVAIVLLVIGFLFAGAA